MGNAEVVRTQLTTLKSELETEYPIRELGVFDVDLGSETDVAKFLMR